MGFENVRTYLQSGNVTFTSKDMNTAELRQKITRQIENDFGLNVPVLILTSMELRHIIDSNPFLKDGDKDPTFMHITFLSCNPIIYDNKAIEDKKQLGEEIVFLGQAVYIYSPNGYGKTKLNNSFLEKKLKVTTTTRNWKTTNELLKMVD